MVAMEGSWQEFLMKTKALVPDAQAFPLSKDCPAVRLPAVSSASVGPAGTKPCHHQRFPTMRPASVTQLARESIWAASKALNC